MDTEIKNDNVSFVLLQKTLWCMYNVNKLPSVTKPHLGTWTHPIGLTFLLLLLMILRSPSYSWFIRRRHAAKKQERATSKKPNAGAQPAGVRRITDGRLASQGEATCLRSLNQAPRCPSPSSITQARCPRVRLAGRLPACVCVILWCPCWGCHLGPSFRTDWLMASTVKQRWEVNAASSKKLLRQKSKQKGLIVQPPTRYKLRCWRSCESFYAADSQGIISSDVKLTWIPRNKSLSMYNNLMHIHT